MKTLIPIVFLFLILCACSAPVVPPDTTSSNASVSSENIVENSLSKEASQSQASEIKGSSAPALIAEKEQKQAELLAELTEESEVTIKQGEADYLFLNYDKERNLSCRMIRTEYIFEGERYYGFDKTITILNVDNLVERAISNTRVAQSKTFAIHA